jgi:hypothetical protein
MGNLFVRSSSEFPFMGYDKLAVSYHTWLVRLLLWLPA